MAVSEKFNEAVRDGKIRSVRIMMKDSLLADLSFSDFKTMESMAAPSMNGLYDAHDGRSFENDKSKWNIDYMNKLMVQVVNNFSHERIAHLKDVVRYLEPELAKSENTKSSKGAEHFQQRSSDYSAPKFSNFKKKLSAKEERAYIRTVSGALVGGVVGAAFGGGVAVLTGITSVALCACVGAAGGAALGIAVTNSFD